MRMRFLALLLPPFVGCGRKADPLREILPVPVGTVLVDSVPAGSLAEGPVEVFGLRLPRSARVTAAMSDTVYATADVSLERMTRYLRERVEADQVLVAPRKASFLAAKIDGGPRLLQLEVVAEAANRVELVLRDVTPAPATMGLSEAERWRRAGRAPDGRVLPDQNR